MYNESTQRAGFLAKYYSEIKAILRRNNRSCPVTGCLRNEKQISGEPHTALKSFLLFLCHSPPPPSPNLLWLCQQYDPVSSTWRGISVISNERRAFEMKVLTRGMVEHCLLASIHT